MQAIFFSDVRRARALYPNDEPPDVSSVVGSAVVVATRPSVDF